MAGPSAHERVKKLESRGVIRGYAAAIEPATVGLNVLAFTWVPRRRGRSCAGPDAGVRRDRRDRGVPLHHRRGRLHAQDPRTRHGASGRRRARGPDAPSTCSPPRPTSCSTPASRAGRCPVKAAPAAETATPAGGRRDDGAPRRRSTRRCSSVRWRRLGRCARLALRPARGRRPCRCDPAHRGPPARRGGRTGDVPRALEPGRAVRSCGSVARHLAAGDRPEPGGRPAAGRRAGAHRWCRCPGDGDEGDPTRGSTSWAGTRP